MDGIWSSILMIILLLLVMLGAYFTTKFLSVKTKRLAKGKYIDIKDRMYVGRDKHIVLVEAGEHYFLIGVTNQAISLIGTLKKEELSTIEEEKAETGAGFKGFFSRFSGFMRNAGSAQEELKKARLAEKIKREASAPKSREEQDEIDKILNAIHQRKQKNTPAGDREGDGHEKI